MCLVNKLKDGDRVINQHGLVGFVKTAPANTDYPFQVLTDGREWNGQVEENGKDRMSSLWWINTDLVAKAKDYLECDFDRAMNALIVLAEEGPL